MVRAVAKAQAELLAERERARASVGNAASVQAELDKLRQAESRRQKRFRMVQVRVWQRLLGSHASVWRSRACVCHAAACVGQATFEKRQHEQEEAVKAANTRVEELALQLQQSVARVEELERAQAEAQAEVAAASVESEVVVIEAPPPRKVRVLVLVHRPCTVLTRHCVWCSVPQGLGAHSAWMAGSGSADSDARHNATSGEAASGSGEMSFVGGGGSGEMSFVSSSAPVVDTASVGVGEALDGTALDVDDRGDGAGTPPRVPATKSSSAEADMRAMQLELALEDALSRVAGLKIEQVSVARTRSHTALQCPRHMHAAAHPHGHLALALSYHECRLPRLSACGWRSNEPRVAATRQRCKRWSSSTRQRHSD